MLAHLDREGDTLLAGFWRLETEECSSLAGSEDWEAALDLSLGVGPLPWRALTAGAPALEVLCLIDVYEALLAALLSAADAAFWDLVLVLKGFRGDFLPLKGVPQCAGRNGRVVELVLFSFSVCLGDAPEDRRTLRGRILWGDTLAPTLRLTLLGSDAAGFWFRFPVLALVAFILLPGFKPWLQIGALGFDVFVWSATLDEYFWTNG